MKSALDRLHQLQEGDITRLEAQNHLDESFHQWSGAEVDALLLAVASRRPLLVRGEPGTGKTQLARAAARQLGWALDAVTIHARYEPQDLMFRFDAVRRLADAQSSGATARLLQKNRGDYWEPGPLWKAFDWDSARRHGSCRLQRECPAGHVILIDEIDKADSDLPNTLLEVLGQRSFPIAALNLRISAAPDRLPLVVITTNEERDLPAAFLRRCVVLNLDAEGDYQQWLVKRGRAHFRDPDAQHPSTHEVPDKVLSTPILEKAARQLVADRVEAGKAGLPPPGLAEYLDLLYGLHALSADAQEQDRWLNRLSAYAFVKHGVIPGQPGLSQRRAVVN